MLMNDATLVGRATAGVSFVVAGKGKSGSVVLVLDVVDSSYALVTSTESFMTWYSSTDDWRTNGNLLVHSEFVVADGASVVTSWNGTANGLYSEGAYKVDVVNNPMSSSQIASRSVSVKEGVVSAPSKESMALVVAAGVQASSSSRSVSNDSTVNDFQAVAEGTFGGAIDDW